MTRSITKFFHPAQYEAEQKWLQKMADEGWALSRKYLFQYEFEKTNPGAYQVRSELKRSLVSHAKSEDFVDFLKEQNVEYLGSLGEWMYLRRRSSQGEFRMYTDRKSRLSYFRRLLRYYLFSLPVLLWPLYIVWTTQWERADPFLKMLAAFVIALVALHFCIILVTGVPLVKKILTLRKEVRICE